MYVVTVGSFNGGFVFNGPFQNIEDAFVFAQTNYGEISELVTPEPGIPADGSEDVDSGGDK